MGDMAWPAYLFAKLVRFKIIKDVEKTNETLTGQTNRINTLTETSVIPRQPNHTQGRLFDKATPITKHIFQRPCNGYINELRSLSDHSNITYSTDRGHAATYYTHFLGRTFNLVILTTDY